MARNTQPDCMAVAEDIEKVEHTAVGRDAVGLDAVERTDIAVVLDTAVASDTAVEHVVDELDIDRLDLEMQSD